MNTCGINTTDLIHRNNITIHLFDEIEFFVFQVLQCHRTICLDIIFPVCKNRLNVEIIKNAEFSFPDTTIQAAMMECQQLRKVQGGFVAAVYHIGWSGIKSAFEILLN